MGKKKRLLTCEMEWGENPWNFVQFRWGNPGTGGASHVDMVGPKGHTEWFTLAFPIEFTHRSSNVASWKTPKTGKFQWETSINTDDCQSATIKIATSYGLHPWYTCSFFWVSPVYLISGQSMTFWTICTSCLGPKIQHSGAGDGLDTLIILGYGYVSMV